MTELSIITTLMAATFGLQLWLTKEIIKISQDIAVIKESHETHSKDIGKLQKQIEDHEHRLIKIETRLGEVYENLNP